MQVKGFSLGMCVSATHARLHSWQQLECVVKHDGNQWYTAY